MDECENLFREAKEFSDSLNHMAYVYGLPIKATLELTPLCNFNCKMCYVHLSSEQLSCTGEKLLSKDEIIDLACQARDLGLLYITLTGGEVFTRQDFQEIYEELNSMGFIITILSNGYLIDEKVVAWLAKRPPRNIRITLYGANNATYKRVCGINDGFDRVSSAIELLQKNNIAVSLVGTIIDENQDDLMELYKFAYQHNIPFHHTVGIVKSVRLSTNNIEKHRLEITKKQDLGNQVVDKQLGFIHQKNYLDDCSSYRTGFVLRWDGKIALCSFMNMPLVDTRKQSFQSAWNRLLIELGKLRKPEKCKECSYENYCKRCPGVLAAECGAPDVVNEEFCQKAKKLYNIYAVK